MTKPFLVTLAALACISLTAASQQNDSFGDSSGIVTAELARSAEEWKNAYNANEVEKLAGFYAEDADYVSPHVPALMIHGRELIRQNFQRGIAGGGHLDSLVVHRSGSSCDLAYLVCAYRATNSGVVVHGKNVLVMKKMREKWLIVTHASIVKD